MTLEFLRKIFEKHSNIKFHENRVELFHTKARTVNCTLRHDDVANAPKKDDPKM